MTFPLCLLQVISWSTEIPSQQSIWYRPTKHFLFSVIADNQPGYYRNPLNEMDDLPCPIGEYQPLKWQYTCISCGGDRYRTDQQASTAKSDCKCKQKIFNLFHPGSQPMGNTVVCTVNHFEIAGVGVVQY